MLTIIELLGFENGINLIKRNKYTLFKYLLRNWLIINQFFNNLTKNYETKWK